MRGLDQAADALRSVGHETHRDRVTDGRDVGVVHRLVRLGLDHDADVLVVVEHLLHGVGDALGGDDGILGFADVGAFTGEPQHDVLGAEGLGDIDGALAALDGVFAALRAVVGVAAVDGVGVEPHARRDELGGQPFAVEDLLELLGLLDDLSGGHLEVAHARHGVVVVELDAVEADLLVAGELLGEGHGLADFGPERIGAFVDVPGTKRESERTGHFIPPV